MTKFYDGFFKKDNPDEETLLGKFLDKSFLGFATLFTKYVPNGFIQDINFIQREVICKTSTGFLVGFADALIIVDATFQGKDVKQRIYFLIEAKAKTPATISQTIRQIKTYRELLSKQYGLIIKDNNYTSGFFISILLTPETVLVS